jgi:hypothetical protein
MASPPMRFNCARTSRMETRRGPRPIDLRRLFEHLFSARRRRAFA